MAIPAQVRRQSEAVNKLYEELNAGAEAQDNSEAEAEAQPVESAKADSVEEGARQPQSGERGTGGDKGEDGLSQKYKTLQGMYNAEVPRLHAEKRELVGRVTQLEQLLASMNTAQSQPKAPAAPLVTEADMEEYGDSIEVMRKVSREEASAYQSRIDQLESVIRQMQANVVPQVQQLTQRQAQSSEQAFWGQLQSVVPDWREINGDQGFQSWLMEVDPLTGISRQTYLDDAQRNLDVGRIANFFNAWKSMTGESVAQNGQSRSGSELERQVAPGRSRSTSNPAQGEGKTYTAADIQKFFVDVQKGKYKGREADRDRIERDIFSAQREGRIVNA